MHLFSDSASHYSSTPLLQKNSACAAADVAISGEIHFGRGSVPINERPDAFDYVEAVVVAGAVLLALYLLFRRRASRLKPRA